MMFLQVDRSILAQERVAQNPELEFIVENESRFVIHVLLKNSTPARQYQYIVEDCKFLASQGKV